MKNKGIFELQALPVVQELGGAAREKLAHVVRTGSTRGASNLSDIKCVSTTVSVIKCVK
jgi:hypothetical protein